MGIYGFDAEDDPQEPCDDVRSYQQRTSSERKRIAQQVLQRMSVFGSDTNSGFEAMVLLVDVLVDEWVMQQTMSPIEKRVFTNHEQQKVFCDLKERR